MPALQVADHSIALLQRVLQRGPPPDELQPMRPGLLLLALALVGAAVGQAVQELQPGPAGGRTAQEPPGGRREPQRQGAVQASGALEKPSVPPQPAVSATPPAPDGLAAEPAEPTDPGMGRESVFGPAAAPPQVWLCSLLTVQPGSAALLRHWIAHYLRLGVRREHFLLLVRHSPASGDTSSSPAGSAFSAAAVNGTRTSVSGRRAAGRWQAELQAVLTVLDEQAINYRLWLGDYSCDLHMKLKLQILAEEVASVADWVLVAGPDEFHVYVTRGVRAFLDALDRRGQNWVPAVVQDRASASVQPVEVTPVPSIFEQYPLHCIARSTAASGSLRRHRGPQPANAVAKVAAFKSLLRTTEGDQHIIEPGAARALLGPGQEGGGCHLTEDLLPLTPYFTHRTRYLYNAAQLQQPGGERLWQPLQSDYVALVQRFRWLCQGTTDAGGGPTGGAAALVGAKCSTLAHNPSYTWRTTARDRSGNLSSNKFSSSFGSSGEDWEAAGGDPRDFVLTAAMAAQPGALLGQG